MPLPLLRVKTDKRGFATRLTAITNGGILRFARSVDKLFNNLLNKVQEVRRLLFTPASILTIASNTITPTQTMHIVAASAGVIDTLNTITAANGKLLFLKADVGDTITLAHGISNIWMPGNNDIVLKGSRGVLLFCESGSWSALCSTSAKVTPDAIVDPGTGDDVADGYSVGSLWINISLERAWICVDNTATTAQWRPILPFRNGWSIRAAAATVQPVGIAAPTLSGAATGNANDAGETLMTIASVSNVDPQGIVTASFDLVRPGYDAIIEIVLKNNGVNGNVYVGLTSGNVTSGGGNLPASTKFIGFRTSSGWKPVLCDGTNPQTDGSVISTFTGTTYRFRIRIVASLGTVYFSVNGSAEQALSTGFPDVSSDMGFVLRIQGNTGPTPLSILFGYVKVNW